MFCPGDLIRIPSNVNLFCLDRLDSPNRYNVTEKPSMAIFIKYKDSRECIINKNGENWIVEINNIRIVEEENGQTNSNN